MDAIYARQSIDKKDSLSIEGQIQKIYVYRLDRFSRSIADFRRLWEALQRYGVEFQSVTEQFDTSSPMGQPC